MDIKSWKQSPNLRLSHYMKKIYLWEYLCLNLILLCIPKQIFLDPDLCLCYNLSPEEMHHFPPFYHTETIHC